MAFFSFIFTVISPPIVFQLMFFNPPSSYRAAHHTTRSGLLPPRGYRRQYVARSPHPPLGPGHQRQWWLLQRQSWRPGPPAAGLGDQIHGQRETVLRGPHQADDAVHGSSSSAQSQRPASTQTVSILEDIWGLCCVLFLMVHLIFSWDECKTIASF